MLRSKEVTMPRHQAMKVMKLLIMRHHCRLDSRLVNYYVGGAIPASFLLVIGQRNIRDEDCSAEEEGLMDEKTIKPKQKANDAMVMEEAHDNTTKVSDQTSIDQKQPGDAIKDGPDTNRILDEAQQEDTTDDELLPNQQENGATEDGKIKNSDEEGLKL